MSWGGANYEVDGLQKTGPGYYTEGHRLPKGISKYRDVVTEAYPFPPFNTETLPCPLGHQPVGNTCIACVPGKKTPGTESDQCRACEAGLISSPAAIHCGHCAAGQYEKTVNDEPCQTCPSGWFQNSSTRLSASCISCPPHTYLAFDETSSPSAHDSLEDCITCASGQFSGPGASFCSPCFAGRFYSASMQRCLDCPIGFYQDSSKKDSCNACAAGTYQPSEKQPYCLLCEVGRYQNEDGASSCYACQAGTIADAANATSCHHCDDAEKIPNELRSSCEPAPWKTIRDCKTFDEYLNNTNTNDKMSWTCLACPPGGDCGYESTSDNLVPKDGWLNYSWASSEQPFAQCPFKSNACQNGTCTEGHTDTLCAVCEPGYTFSSSMQACTLCTTGQVLISVGIILVLGMVMLVFLWVKRKKIRKAQQKYSKGKGFAKFCF